MGLIFVHDHYFIKYKDKYYSNNFTHEVIKRYSSVFGDVKFITRGKDVNEVNNGLSVSSAEGVEFVRVPNYKSIKELKNINVAKRILKFEVENADFVIARTSSLGYLAVKYAKKFKKPYLVEVVSCTWDALWNYSVVGKIVAPFSYLSQKRMVKNASHVIYVTNEFLQRRYPTKGKSVNCSNVNLSDFNNETIKKRIEKVSKINEETKLILGTTAAVNVKYKGQQYVIAALAKLNSEGYRNFEYHLVGGGDQSYLQSIAAKYNVLDQVKFLGTLSHNEVFEWLDTIDIYIQPSKQEGLPRALIEAMSRGCFALGANTAGIPELLNKDCVFSNTRKNINEIYLKLKNVTPEIMLSYAKLNVNEAKKYDKKIIESRRSRFLIEFMNDI